MLLDLLISRPYYFEGSKCGYCNGQKRHFLGLPGLPDRALPPDSPAHITLGCHLDQVTCAYYDRLVNLGFRRSGTFLYKGDMLRGCCRMYTIRTTLGSMKLSKDHRQTVNRFTRAISSPSASADQPASGDTPCGAASRATQRRGTARPAHRPARAARNGKPASAPFSLWSLVEAEHASSRFHTRYEPAEFSEDKYALYKKYQVAVHNDEPHEVTPAQFSRFLCETPFKDEEIEGTDAEWHVLNAWVLQAAAGGPGVAAKCATGGVDSGLRKHPRRLGPVHECYYLDGALIAISVLDFLPSGVSSVYFIWDPDYAYLSLGTLLALRELQMCHVLGLGFYYLGYYIGDCDKMKYKGKYGGELLDVCAERYYSLNAVQRAQEAHAQDDSAVHLSHEQLHDRFWLFDAGAAGAERELVLDGMPGKVAGEAGVETLAVVYEALETYRVADEAKSAILAHHNVGALQIPAVLPGCMPMLQVLKWLQLRESARMPVTIYVSASGQLRKGNFARLSRDLRAAVVDFVRMFGFACAQEAVIIV